MEHIHALMLFRPSLEQGTNDMLHIQAAQVSVCLTTAHKNNRCAGDVNHG